MRASQCYKIYVLWNRKEFQFVNDDSEQIFKFIEKLAIV